MGYPTNMSIGKVLTDYPAVDSEIDDDAMLIISDPKIKHLTRVISLADLRKAILRKTDDS